MTADARRRLAAGAGLLSAALVGGLLVTAPPAAADITSAGPSPVNTGEATVTFTTDGPVALGSTVVFDGPAADDTFTARVDSLEGGDPRRPQTTVDFSSPDYETAPDGPANPGPYAVTLRGLASSESCTSCFTVLAPSLPTVASVAPTGVPRGTTQQVVLTGTGFSRDTRVLVLDADGSVPASDAVAQVVARRPAAADSPDGTGAATPGSLRRLVEVRPGAPLGARTLRLVATDGRSRDCVGCFSVFGPPLTSFSPQASTNTGDDGAVAVRLTAPAGTFGPDAVPALVHVGSSRGSATAAALSITGRRTGLVPGSGTTDDVLTAVFDLRGAAPGQDAYQPTVTSSTGGTNAAPRDRFDVTQPSPPTVAGVAPTTRAAGTAERVNVSGTGFARGAVLTLRGGSEVSPFPVVPGTDVQVTGTTTLSALVTIPADAPSGPRDVVVTNTDAESGSRPGALTVTPAAAPSSSAPASTPGTPSPTASPSPTATPTRSATPSPSATATTTTTPSSTGSPTPSALPAPTRPRLSLPRTTITSQQSAQVLGTADPGSVVELYAYSRPRTTYVRVRRALVGGSGQVAFEVGPSGNTRMYLRRTDAGGGRVSDSPSVVLTVRTGINLKVARVGTKTYRFTGSTLPKRRGQTVNVRYRSGGRVVVASKARVAADGTYAVVRRFTGSGTFELFTDTGTDINNAAGTSRAVRTTLR